MALEGELRVGLRVGNGHIDRVRVASTRPDVARTLLQSRTRAEVSAAVPLLFSICGRSQSAANELACAAACDEALPGALSRCAGAVAAETVRECAWRTLLDWPRWIGEQPADDAVAAARLSLAFRCQEAAAPDAQAIAVAAFGMSGEEWLGLQSLPELDRWIDTGRTAASRFIRLVRDDDAADGDCHPPRHVPLLDGRHHATWIEELAAAAEADPDFARQPNWHGTPAETGALARQQDDPLVDALSRRSTSRVPARFVARLRELALLLSGRSEAAVGAWALPSAGGMGWVENARGLLIHQVRLSEDIISHYRIVAPTEWNFHPEGALALALSGMFAGDLATVKAKATRLIRSLDPCVAFQVEFDDA